MFAQDDEAADALQRAAQRDLFGHEQRFVEAAGSLERGPRAEHIAAGRPAHETHALGDGEQRHRSPPRLRSFHTNRRAAADGALGQRHEGGPQQRGRDERVSVDEDEDPASGRASACVADASNLTVLAVDDAGAVRAGDGGRRVGGRVVGDDDFVWLGDLTRGCVDGVERPSKQPLLVVGGNDERDYSRSSALSCFSHWRLSTMPACTSAIRPWRSIAIVSGRLTTLNILANPSSPAMMG